MSNSFVTVESNSFENKTTAKTSTISFDLKGRSTNDSAIFGIRYVSCPPNIDTLLIDVVFTSYENHFRENSVTFSAGEWAFLRNGNLIIQINDVDNYPLEPMDLGSDVNSVFSHNSIIVEAVGYVIDKDFLKKMCDATTMKMQLAGEKGTWQLDASQLIFLAKAFYNGFYDENAYIEDIKAQEAANAAANAASNNSGGCYVATAVYGSYDCPEVWTLRRFRDYTLDETWYGRLFIKTYYAISPTIVKLFGKTEWFRQMWKSPLDRMVRNLQKKGVASTPYYDKY